MVCRTYPGHPCPPRWFVRDMVRLSAAEVPTMRAVSVYIGPQQQRSEEIEIKGWLGPAILTETKVTGNDQKEIS